MFTRLFCIIVCLSASFSYADSSTQAEYKEGEVFIRFAPKEKGKLQTLSEKQSFLKSRLGSAKIKKQYDIVSDLTLVELPAGVKVADAIKSLKNSADILYIEPNYKLYAMTVPNDPYFSNLWGLHNTGQSFPDEYNQMTSGTVDADIDAPEAWDIHTDANNIIVAVIDTGIDYTHPDLAANMWVNQAELVGDPNFDDDGNGYKDDIYGYDFCTYDGKQRDSDPNDDYLHGTHVAGTIGAVGNNGIGVVGVGWNVKLMSVKFLDEDGYGLISDVIDAIKYAVNNGAKVLNNSWGGGGYSQSLLDTIEYAKQKNVLFVAAAGNHKYAGFYVILDNDQFPAYSYPSSYPSENIISVMATDYNDQRSIWNFWNESHYGLTSVDIAAPGTDVFSTFPTYSTYAMNYWDFSTYYETISGTSMAAPHVAGACALVWSMYPHLTAAAVKQAILDGADQLDSLDGLCVTGGRLNLYKALLAACPLTLDIEDDVSACTSPGDAVTYTITCSNPTITNPNDPNYYGPVDDITITTYLPKGVTCSAANLNYDPETHTYIWTIDTLDPGESESTTLTVTVNNGADPGLPMEIRSVLRAANACKEAETTTPVCCWDPGDIIYVNADAAGLDTGVGWVNAYTTLQKAIARINRGCGDEIWVAKGTYTPGDSTTDSFIIPAGVCVYGGFAGWEMSVNRQNIAANPTILSGCINETTRSEAVVVMDANTLLDGFIVEDGQDGVFSEGDITVRNCRIRGNTLDGIHHQGADKTASVFNCWITGNLQNGCCFIDSAAILKNNIFNSNSSDTGGEYYGLCFDHSPAVPIVYNNTFVNNCNYAVATINPAPNYPQYPDIQNCIVWYNNNDDEQLYGYEHTQYSCVYDPNNRPDDPNGMDYTFDAYGNFSGLPGFVCNYVNDPNADPNSLDVHLAYDSFCRDMGSDSLSYTGQVDIDGENRVMGPYADIGADEYVDARHYRFDELDGLTAYDSGPVYQYNGVLMNGSVWEHGPVWEPNNGVFGGALRFDGVDDYVKITDPNYYGVTGSNPRTCSAWVKTTYTGNYQIIMSWGTTDADGWNAWMMALKPSGQLGISIFGGEVDSTTAGLNDGRWHHVAATLSEDLNDDDRIGLEDIQLYVDGQLEERKFLYNSANLVVNTSGNTPVTLGVADYDGYPYGWTYMFYFHGMMDDARIYQVAWDANDVEAHYQSARVAQLRDEAIVYYTCDEDSGTTLNDLGGDSQQNGTLNGPTWTTSGTFGKAISFDGVNDYANIPTYNGISGTHARSVSVWFKTSSPVWQAGGSMHYNIPFVQWGHEDVGTLWMVYLRPDRIASVAVASGGVHNNTALNDGTWHNLVVVLEEGESVSDNIKLYVDGQLDSTGYSPYTCTINTNTASVPVHIGARCWYNNGSPYIDNYAEATIDEIRIYDQALTEDDVQIIYKEFEN